MAKALWPQGDTDTRQIQIGELSQELGDLTSQTAAMVNRGLQLLMSDVQVFVDFPHGGMYSGSEVPSLPENTHGLDLALRLYVLTTALSKNGWYVSLWNQSYILKDEARWCNGGHRDGNICVDRDGWWAAYMSPVNLGLFSKLEHLDDAVLLPYHSWQDIQNKNWSPLSLLFDGTYNCTIDGKTGGNPITFNPDGTFAIGCTSVLPMYKIFGYPCPVATNGTCPFKDIPHK